MGTSKVDKNDALQNGKTTMSHTQRSLIYGFFLDMFYRKIGLEVERTFKKMYQSNIFSLLMILVIEVGQIFLSVGLTSKQ